MIDYYVNPDPYYTPKVSIGPFNLKNIATQSEPDFQILDCLGTNLLFTNSGKEAIRLALEYLEVRESNVVGIVTTSGNSYVSKCVTETISDFCMWEMYDSSEKFDLLFVIHEFGFVQSLESMNQLRSSKVPIINDFAYSFLSLYLNKRNDFSNEINLTSFPKCFDINFGGVVHLPNFEIKASNHDLRASILEKVGMELNIDAIQKNITLRQQNREFYKTNLQKYGYQVIWDEKEICPGVCMIAPLKPVNLQELKNFLQRNGIESSVFYGKQVFFVPVHHFMSRRELEYVCFMIGAFANAN